jgi:hypothetical protein
MRCNLKLIIIPDNENILFEDCFSGIWITIVFRKKSIRELRRKAMVKNLNFEIIDLVSGKKKGRFNFTCGVGSSNIFIYIII